jgi:TonB family protein
MLICGLVFGARSKIMCCKIFWKRIVPFALALMFGLLAVNILQKVNPASKTLENLKPVNKIIYSERGTGASSCFGNKFDTNLNNESSKTSRSGSNNVQIISKPRANYTDAARQNNIQGTVTLRVVFLANGQIGDVSPVNSLPHGLTKEAMSAAKQIRFEPAMENGIPQSVVKQVQYSFTIY